MPTYEYECDACGQRHEAFQAMKDKPLRKCPACGKSSLVRLIGAGAGVIFKGSGFYETDYKRSGAADKKADKPADAPAAASAPASTTAASTTAPAPASST